AGAWAHFQAGRQGDYLQAIVEAVANAPATESVVLAQASMAPAAELLAARGITALTSPRLGVEHAVSICTSRPAS
ncbi:MAG TPA: Asp/Glu/hydantoin racemase, partial [Rhizobacter sp.]|nr:Asp/Glu/hydantoin racemase [Rhizobacter sp.]